MPNDPIMLPTQPKTSGVWPSTEFYFALVTAIAGLLGQAAGFVPEPWGAILTAVSTAAYALSRGLGKSGGS